MLRFVARQDDPRAVRALDSIEKIPGLEGKTQVLPQDGSLAVEPGDIVFFTPSEERKGHWASRWLCTSQKHAGAIRPEWARGAKAVVALRPRSDPADKDRGAHFTAAVQNAACMFAGVKPPELPQQQRSRGSRWNRRSGHRVPAYM